MKKISLIIAALTVLFVSCEKTFDSPPPKTLAVGSVYTMKQLRDLHTGTTVRFTDDKSVYGVVTMDEQDGNNYKNIYVQGGNAAINVRLVSSGGLYKGDSIRIYLKGTILSKYNGMLQLDSVDVDKNIVKQKTLVNVTPKTVTVAELADSLQGRLVKIDNVEFVPGDTSKTFADAVNQSSVSLTIRDCSNKQVILRTSGFANYAGTKVPTGNGSIVAIVSVFNSTVQLYARSYGEINMSGARCGAGVLSTLNEDFSGTTSNVDIDFPGWYNIGEEGNRKWRGAAFSTQKYAQATAFSSTDASNKVWIITPQIVNSATKKLSLKTQKAFYNHTTTPFSIWISTDFTGTNFSTATWTEVTGATVATSASADNTWISSGDISLSPFLPVNYTGNFCIGFKYAGAAPSQTTSYRIDDVSVTD